MVGRELIPQLFWILGKPVNADSVGISTSSLSVVCVRIFSYLADRFVF